MANIDNLKPFKKGYDPRRQNGRKKGSKNTATLVKSILETELSEVKSEKMRELIEQYSSRDVREAIIYAMVEKSLSGSIKSTEWLFKYLDTEVARTDTTSFFNAPEIHFTVVGAESLEDEESVNLHFPRTPCASQSR